MYFFLLRTCVLYLIDSKMKGFFPIHHRANSLILELRIIRTAVQGAPLGQRQHQQPAAAAMFPDQIPFFLPFPPPLPSLRGRESGREGQVCMLLLLSLQPSHKAAVLEAQSGQRRRTGKEKAEGCQARLPAQLLPAA